ncbi:MAG: hypothetical protein AMDU4_FER2C00073G0015 [Ferroplasma sp. Type II]|jgi:hypothetical protein|nr:MAG: hypothetical protein AMDU4_FER2C00073G0015 [Ferroplasma sp. Type II]
MSIDILYTMIQDGFFAYPSVIKAVPVDGRILLHNPEIAL